MEIIVGTLATLTAILLLLAALVIAGRFITKKLTIKQKNWWLIAHILFVTVYFSGLFSTLLLAGMTTTIITDRAQIYAAHLFSKYSDWFLIIPGAFGSMVTGVWLSVRTHWGFTKYYWIIIKILGNTVAILYGATFMRIWFDQTVALSSVSQVNILQNPAYLHNRLMLITGSVISIAILVFLVIISVIKPYGKRNS
jgi:hypothetical protein